MAIRAITFAALMVEKAAFDETAISSGKEENQSPQWNMASGSPINSDCIGEDVFIGDLEGFFFMPQERGGFTVYRVDMRNFTLSHASKASQFKDAEDAAEVAAGLAAGRYSVELVKEAAAKGKGRNAAALTLFVRNRKRSESLVEYREKMRKRQIPLKSPSQWVFFTGLIDKGVLTARAIEGLKQYADEIEATRTGAASPHAADWTVKDAERVFLSGAVEG